MRNSTILLWLCLSLALANGFSTRKVRDADDSSLETSPSGLSSGSELRQEPSALTCGVAITALGSAVPADILNIVRSFLFFPDFILNIFVNLIPNAELVTLLKFVISCWRANYLEIFVEAPSAAVASLEGPITGDVLFSETWIREDSDSSMAVMARLEGLTPDATYSMSVHESGDVSDSCKHIGEHHSSLGEGNILADSEGRGVLIVEKSSARLEGSESVMGRSLVLTNTSGDEAPVCATIVRNSNMLSQTN